MWTSTLLIATCFALAAGVCPRYEKEYYEELGCEPGVLGSDGCPRSYDCSKISKRDQTKCLYKGQEYSEGHEFHPDDDCLRGCRCRKQYDSKMAFTCANVECAELFLGPPSPGCYRVYDHDKCCSTDEVCVSAQPVEQKTSKTVCQYGGQEYKEGMRFYPEEEPCLVCICQAGFNGSFVEPFCKKVKCSLELHYGTRINQGCVPVFYGKNDCCPIDWRCPEQTDTLISTATTKTDSDLQCHFGDLKMQVGDKLGGGQSKDECTCRVPPHPICIKQQE